MDIITVRIGDPDYERYLGPILDAPEPEIWADAEIDMRRQSQTDPDKRWWLAVRDGEVLAWCALWTANCGGYDWECGHNYERRGQGRECGAYRRVFLARQAWISPRRKPCTTWVFDQPVGIHLAHGWTRTCVYGVSEHGHHWQKLVWSPR